MAKGVIFNRHGHKDYYDWKDIITVDIENLEDETIGTLKSHPKVFVGFYSHAAFRQKCDAKVTSSSASERALADMFLGWMRRCSVTGIHL